jgi:hypothetical protein
LCQFSTQTYTCENLSQEYGSAAFELLVRVALLVYAAKEAAKIFALVIMARRVGRRPFALQSSEAALGASSLGRLAYFGSSSVFAPLCLLPYLGLNSRRCASTLLLPWTRGCRFSTKALRTFHTSTSRSIFTAMSLRMDLYYCLKLAFHLRDDRLELLSVGEGSGAGREILCYEARSGERRR